ncbi:NVEALA domain-containing protein [Dysgonomonas mossii]|uniref:NVEALA domain-containing protein n=1 Tax=Dysgonomonas mossii TaxID=163665 RepID=UPI003994E88B
MKKKIIGSITVMAIAAVAAFNINLSNPDKGLSNISLANVEALASSEGGSLCSQYCTSSNSYHCHGQNSSMEFTCYYMRVK